MSDVKVPGYLIKQIKEALVIAFPGTTLAMMVQERLDENLQAIVGTGSLNEVVFKLVQYFEAQGKLDKLIQGACKENNSNPKLKKVAEKFYIITSLLEILQPLENYQYIQAKMQQAYKACYFESSLGNAKLNTPYNLNDILKGIDDAYQKDNHEKPIVQFVANLLNILSDKDIPQITATAHKLKKWGNQYGNNFNTLLKENNQELPTENVVTVIPTTPSNPKPLESRNKYVSPNNNQSQTANTQNPKSSQNSPPIPEPPKVPRVPEGFPQINTFTFKVATIAKETKSISYRSRQNRYFTENLGNKTSLEMVEIPGGTFTMGAPETEEGSKDSERPQHQVTVSSFFMGKYPITQAQWKAVAALPRVNRDLKPDPSYFKGDNLPVEGVSWYEAFEFCARLSNHTGREYRLPNEAEWEYACRAGTTTPFHFGEIITSELANYAPNFWAPLPSFIPYFGKGTTPVGSFQVANAFGLYDMHGNVWEWCLDRWHSDYKGAPTDGNTWASDNDNLFWMINTCVMRGGSWDLVLESCRSASRPYYSWTPPVIYYCFVGFRVVCAFGRTFK